jgi:hypothetical protein
LVITEDNEEFYCNKIIIESVCLNFIDKLDNVIKIPKKYSKKTIYDILNYIYYGNIKINEDNVYDLILCSEYFGLSNLKLSCFQFISKSLNEKSVFNMTKKINNGEFEFDTNELLLECSKYISSNAYNIFQNDEYLSLSYNIMLELVKSDETYLDELSLYNYLKKWCDNNKISIELRKNIMNYLRLIKK